MAKSLGKKIMCSQAPTPAPRRQASLSDWWSVVVCACVWCACMLACVHACMCVCACACVRVRVRACVRASARVCFAKKKWRC